MPRTVISPSDNKYLHQSELFWSVFTPPDPIRIYTGSPRLSVPVLVCVFHITFYYAPYYSAVIRDDTAFWHAVNRQCKQYEGQFTKITCERSVKTSLKFLCSGFNLDYLKINKLLNIGQFLESLFLMSTMKTSRNMGRRPITRN